MRHRFLSAIVTAGCLLAAWPAQAQTARELYTRAMAQERAVRDESTKPTLVQMRRAVALYESVVRKHPASGYADNALWQAANLASLAVERFGQDADRKTATRLLTLLTKEYPTSKLVAQAKDALAAPAAAAPVPEPKPSRPAAAEADARTPPRTAPPPVAPAPIAPATAATAATADRKSRTDATATSTTSGMATLKDVKRTVLPDGVRLTVELDGEIAYHQEEIDSPRRLFFDLKNVKAAPGLQDTSLRFADDVVKEVRLGRHPQNTTRVVVDLDGVAGYSVYPLYGPYRLVIDFRRTSAAPAPLSAAVPATVPVVMAKAEAPSLPVATMAVKTPPPPPLAAPVTPPVTARTSGPATTSTTTASATTSEHVETKAPLPSKPATAALPPAAPAANSNGKFSLSRQLGLGVARVVIDAGHGGHDPGAHGNGINEAELTLDVALRLQTLLEKEGVEVVMTRDTDVFIPLEERTAIANREGADLFLSIHANASRNVVARGIETYFLNFANNPEAEAVAARENATSGKPMHSLPDIVKAIALNNKINESRELAETVQKSMVKRLGAKNKTLKDLGVKQAPFVVLIGAAMPSVLAEISFVTNKQDGTLLKTQGYRQQIAQALMDAVLGYQQSLKRMTGIAAKKATNQ
jgi:N-acetylmuramoyl-L-alanine amidase